MAIAAVAPEILTNWLQRYDARIVGRQGTHYTVAMDQDRWPGNGNLEYISSDPAIAVVLQGWQAPGYDGDRRDGMPPLDIVEAEQAKMRQEREAQQ